MTCHYVCAKIGIMRFLYPLTVYRRRIFYTLSGRW
nr:MAG TPA: hypothetical protein [Caudoviricetes sp.]